MERLDHGNELAFVHAVIDDALPVFSRRIVDASYLFYEALPETVTRTPHCGPLSHLLVGELVRNGLAARSVAADISDIAEMNHDQVSHVIALVNINGEDYMLDATYGQFFSRFGIDWRHLQNDPDIFPKEQYILMHPSEAHEAAAWAAHVVAVFWAKYGYDLNFQLAHNYTYTDEDALSRHTYFCRRPSQAQVEEYFENLWDIERYRDFRFNREFLEDVSELAIPIAAS